MEEKVNEVVRKINAGNMNADSYSIGPSGTEYILQGVV